MTVNPLKFSTKPPAQSVTLRHLRIFIAVADLGTMTAAAKSLYVAQPTVSQAIAELEDFYGVKLFERLSRRLFITAQGRQLLSYARHISSLYKRMDLAMGESGESGAIQVGASMTIGTCFLPQIVEVFLKAHADVPIHAVIRNTRDIEAMILKNDLDLAVVEGSVRSPEILEDSFDEDRLLLLCGRGHALYGVQTVEASDLRDLKFIVREEGSGTRELFENTMAALDIPWQPAWVCSGSDGMISAAVHNLGIAVISQRLAAAEVASGALWPVHAEGLDLRRRFSVIRHKNKYLTGTMKAFIKICMTQAGSDDIGDRPDLLP